jgi:anti-anti-sigma regulatory factor
VRDLDSGEPTVLNGTVIPAGEEWPLHAGDRLEVGPLEFLIQFREKPLSGRDLEEWAAKCLDVTADKELFTDALERENFHRPTNASSAAAGIIDKLQAQRGLVMGRLRIGRDGDVTTVRFNDRHLIEEGEIALIRSELCEYLAHPNLRVLLDFKNVRRMSTSAINMLREFYIWLRPWGSSLAFCRVRADIRPILATMGLNVPVFHDRHAAIGVRW